MHPEDAVARASASIFVALLPALLAACPPRAPSAHDGQRPRRDRDAARHDHEEDDDEAADRAALDAGLSLRALSCENDRQCLTHRCDVGLERCRFPCRDDSDCQAGARCAVDAGAFAACFKNP